MKSFPLLRCLLAAALLSGTLGAYVRERATSAEQTDYAAELAQVDAAISDLDRGPPNPNARVQRAFLVCRRALLTAEPAGYTAAEAAVADALVDANASQALHLLNARLDITLHRNADAKRELHQVTSPAARADLLALEGDIAVQEGRYADAREAYAQAIAKNRGADTVSRLAYLTVLTGDADGADALYSEAEDDVTAKDMRAYAWIEVQRGQLEFRRGRQDAAQAHYDRANAAYTGYWLVEEHLAELAGARGEFSTAIALYERVIARTARPEAAQALGDLYLYQGEPDRARPWHERALAAYVASVQRGEVHYLHHLATFYADVRQDGAQALDWARRDFAQRQDVAARDALAWALFRDGQFDAGSSEMDRALPFASADAHVLAHAAMIDFAAGRADVGKRLLQQAAIVNPHYQSFHVHH